MSRHLVIKNLERIVDELNQIVVSSAPELGDASIVKLWRSVSELSDVVNLFLSANDSASSNDLFPLKSLEAVELGSHTNMKLAREILETTPLASNVKRLARLNLSRSFQVQEEFSNTSAIAQSVVRQMKEQFLETLSPESESSAELLKFNGYAKLRFSCEKQPVSASIDGNVVRLGETKTPSEIQIVIAFGTEKSEDWLSWPLNIDGHQPPDPVPPFEASPILQTSASIITSTEGVSETSGGENFNYSKRQCGDVLFFQIFQFNRLVDTIEILT